MTQPIAISASTRVMWLWLLLLAATGLCLLALGVRAEVPLRIEYQGVADDGMGQPLNGTATIGLSLWDAPLGGAQIFSETHSGVAVVGGVFAVEIGGGTGDTLDAALFDDPTRWVEISVDGNLLAPRQQLLSVPYAFQTAPLPAVQCATPFKLLGLTASGGLLCGDPAGGGTRISLEPGGDPGVAGDDVGEGSSIAIASDGFPIISYFDGGMFQDVRVVHCTNSSCSTTDPPVTLDGAGIVGRHTSIAIGVDGIAVISYSDETTGALKVLQCDDSVCSGWTTTITLDGSGDAAPYSSLVIGSDGFPVISFTIGTVSPGSHDLKVVHCTSPACSTADPPITLTSRPFDPLATTIAIGTDGFPVVSYVDYAGFNLTFVHCSNVSCSSMDTPVVLDSNGNIGAGSSIAIGADGFPVISYRDSVGGVWVIHCTTELCTTSDSPTIVDTVGGAGSNPSTSIAIGVDGFPIIVYDDPANLLQKIVHCADPACTTFDVPVSLDSGVDLGRDSSIAIGEYGLPVISYRDETNADLKVARCHRLDCREF